MESSRKTEIAKNDFYIYQKFPYGILLLRTSLARASIIISTGTAPLFLTCFPMMSKMSMVPSPSPSLMHSSFSWQVALMLKGLQPLESNSLMQMMDSSWRLELYADAKVYTFLAVNPMAKIRVSNMTKSQGRSGQSTWTSSLSITNFLTGLAGILALNPNYYNRQ